MVTPATLPSPARGATDLPAALAAGAKRNDAAGSAGTPDFDETIDQYLGEKPNATGVRVHAPPMEMIEPVFDSVDDATGPSHPEAGVRNHQPPEELPDAAADTAATTDEAPDLPKAVRPHAPPADLASEAATEPQTNSTASRAAAPTAAAAMILGVPGYTAKQRMQSLLLDAEKADDTGATGKRFSGQG